MFFQFFKRDKLTQNPIFIIGYPRSGTTLLQALLATQGGIFTLPETHFFSVVCRKIKTDDSGNIDKECLESVFQRVHEKMDIRINERGQKKFFSRALKQNLRTKDLFEYIVLYHLKKEPGFRKWDNQFRWVEKTPNHAFFLEDIFSIYPNANFINIVRHPVPTVFSRKANFPFNRDMTLTCLAQRWKKNVEDTASFSRAHPSTLYQLKYEDLTENLEFELEKLSDFLEFKLNLELLKNHSEIAPRLISSQETWKEENKSLVITNANFKYKTIISRAEAEEIENVVMGRMTDYGYSSFFNGDQINGG